MLTISCSCTALPLAWLRGCSFVHGWWQSEEVTDRALSCLGNCWMDTEWDLFYEREENGTIEAHFWDKCGPTCCTLVHISNIDYIFDFVPKLLGQLNALESRQVCPGSPAQTLSCWPHPWKAEANHTQTCISYTYVTLLACLSKFPF